MRPGQNKQRMRGRSSSGGRKGPNPLTRSFESNGPDVKIRGTAQHIGEKYLQLARDAQTSGDPVAAENYLQHAEHYFRLIAAAQLAQQQAVQGYQRPEGEAEEAEDEDDLGGLPDRFASPFDRQIQPPQQIQQPAAVPQNYQERGEQGGQPRHDQPRQDQPRYDQPRHDQQPRQDNRGQDNRGGERQERHFNDRGFGGQDRNDRGQDRNGPRENRWQRDNRPQRPHDQQRDNRPREPYAPREAFVPRENPEPRAVAQEATVEESIGLPAFITTPVRVPISTENAEVVNPAPVPAVAAEETAPAKVRRPRRKRPAFEEPGVAAATETEE